LVGRILGRLLVKSGMSRLLPRELDGVQFPAVFRFGGGNHSLDGRRV
jgi:hypothetical protein